MALAALLPGVAQPLSIFLHVAFGISALFLLITTLRQTGRVFIYKMATILILAYLLHPQASIVFLLFIIPGMLLVFRYWSERWKRFGYLLSWLTFVLFGLGSWLLVYPEFDFTQTQNSPWIFIGYPLVVLLGMVWIRWWAVDLPKLPFEAL
jgi:hypothetical protein